MAYGRKRTYGKKASRSTRKSYSRSGRRRSYGRKRTYRKKTSMSRRSILNLTARKKRNAMLGWSNTTAAGARQATVTNPGIVRGSSGWRSIWTATGMDLTDSSSILGRVAEQAVRTATTCYLRGVSEHIRITTNSQVAWYWRRVCFTYKGPALGTFSKLDTPVDTTSRYLDTTVGMQRLLFNELVNNQSNTINDHDSIIYKGAKGVDWNDPMIAALDPLQITIKYDKTRIISSNNDKGVLKEFKLWHPMNQNVVYADDETGDSETTSYVSTASKAGMGDYYIMDVIYSGNATDTDLLSINTSTNLYWHEK